MWSIVLFVGIGISLIGAVIGQGQLYYIHEKNKEKYIYFNGAMGSASIIYLALCLISIFSIIHQQQEGLLEMSCYFSFFGIIPLLIFSFLCVLKTFCFRIEMGINRFCIRGSFGKTRQFVYREIQYRIFCKFVVVFYHKNRKYIYIGNSVLTPGIEDIYSKIRP